MTNKSKVIENNNNIFTSLQLLSHLLPNYSLTTTFPVSIINQLQILSVLTTCPFQSNYLEDDNANED